MLEDKHSSIFPLSYPSLPIFLLDVDRVLFPEINRLRENMKETFPSYFQDNWGSIKSSLASKILEGAHLRNARVKIRMKQSLENNLNKRNIVFFLFVRK
jgi:hypothetical protein